MANNHGILPVITKTSNTAAQPYKRMLTKDLFRCSLLARLYQDRNHITATNATSARNSLAIIENNQFERSVSILYFLVVNVYLNTLKTIIDVKRMIAETPDSVIEFWFGPGESALEINAQKKSLWWLKNSEVDAEINRRFSTLVGIVQSGMPVEWSDTARSILAAIICLDQFPRNMYRGLAQAFAYDFRALELAEELVASGRDQELLSIQRVFCYLPFEHSEDIADQHKAIGLYDNLRDEVKISGATNEVCDIFEGSYQFAVRHLDIIERFGRFPHRNKILSRQSSEEEVSFLSQPGSSF